MTIPSGWDLTGKKRMPNSTVRVLWLQITNLLLTCPLKSSTSGLSQDFWARKSLEKFPGSGLWLKFVNRGYSCVARLGKIKSLLFLSKLRSGSCSRCKGSSDQSLSFRRARQPTASTSFNSREAPSPVSCPFSRFAISTGLSVATSKAEMLSACGGI